MIRRLRLSALVRERASGVARAWDAQEDRT